MDEIIFGLRTSVWLVIVAVAMAVFIIWAIVEKIFNLRQTRQVLAGPRIARTPTPGPQQGPRVSGWWRRNLRRFVVALVLAVVAVGVVIAYRVLGLPPLRQSNGIRWWALGFFLLPVALGAIAIGRCLKNYTVGSPTIEKNGLLRRLFEGNPTRGGIRISQLGLWVIIASAGLVVALYFFLPSSSSEALRLGSTALLTLVLAASLAALGIKEIPGTPEPHRGIYLWMGSRTDTEVAEGFVFILGGPEDLYLINMRKRSMMVEIAEVIVKGNARVRVRCQVPWQPDPDRLAEFVHVGEDRGVVSLAIDYVKERVRDFLIKRPDWRTDTRTVMQISGVVKGRMKREAREEEFQLEPWEDALTLRSELYPELIESITSEKGMDRKTMLQRGCADQFHWGVRFMDIALPTLVPIGRTQEAADTRAAEAAEREGRVYEVATHSAMAYQIIDQAALAGITIPFDRALEIVLSYDTAREGHGFALPGISGPLMAIVERILGNMVNRSATPTGSGRHERRPT